MTYLNSTFILCLCYTGYITNATRLRQGISSDNSTRKPFRRLPKSLTLPISPIITHPSKFWAPLLWTTRIYKVIANSTVWRYVSCTYSVNLSHLDIVKWVETAIFYIMSIQNHWHCENLIQIWAHLRINTAILLIIQYKIFVIDPLGNTYVKYQLISTNINKLKLKFSTPFQDWHCWHHDNLTQFWSWQTQGHSK